MPSWPGAGCGGLGPQRQGGAAVQWKSCVGCFWTLLDGLVDFERWSVGEAVLSNVMPLMADIHETEAIHHGSRYPGQWGFQHPHSACGKQVCHVDAGSGRWSLMQAPSRWKGSPSPSPTHDRGMSESPRKLPGWLPGYPLPPPLPPSSSSQPQHSGAVSPFRSLAWGRAAVAATNVVRTQQDNAWRWSLIACAVQVRSPGLAFLGSASLYDLPLWRGFSLPQALGSMGWGALYSVHGFHFVFPPGDHRCEQGM